MGSGTHKTCSSSETVYVRDTQSLNGFSVISKCMTLNDPINSIKFWLPVCVKLSTCLLTVGRVCVWGGVVTLASHSQFASRHSSVSALVSRNLQRHRAVLPVIVSLSQYGHIVRLTKGLPAHDVFQCQVSLPSCDGLLGRNWRHRPGCPRARWTDYSFVSTLAWWVGA